PEALRPERLVQSLPLTHGPARPLRPLPPGQAPARAGEGGGGRPAGPGGRPGEAVLASEELRQVLDIIAGLSREQQEVIALRFMAELRYGEIAQVTGKREAAVKMIAYRALEEIRRRYESVPR